MNYIIVSFSQNLDGPFTVLQFAFQYTIHIACSTKWASDKAETHLSHCRLNIVVCPRIIESSRRKLCSFGTMFSSHFFTPKCALSKTSGYKLIFIWLPISRCIPSAHQSSLPWIVKRFCASILKKWM